MVAISCMAARGRVHPAAGFGADLRGHTLPVNDAGPDRGEPPMRERFTQDMKDAMKAGDKRRLSTVRLVQAALKDKDIEARGAGRGQASDEDILGLLQKMIKQRQESAGIYEEAGRAELAAQEREEAAIIAAYLPQQMDEAEMRAAVTAAIAATGAGSVKDMGKVIGALRGRYAGQMDFGKVSALVKEMLPKS
jgi:uncharacterized protein YqeY